ncbi:MAG: hypothetical protein AAFR36_07100 [Bacteroidota bacterium]
MRIITISLLLLFSLSLHAQLQKGGKYFNSTIQNFGLLEDYLTNNGDLGGASLLLSPDSEAFSASVFPEYGVFVSDHLLVGGGFLGAYQSDFDFDFTVLALVPFARYYFNPQASNTYFFSQLQFDVIGSFFDGESEYDLGADLSVGITHRLGEGMALDAFLGLRNDDLQGELDVPLRIFAGTTLGIYLQQDQWAGRKAAQAGFKAGSWMIGGTASGFSWEPVEDGRLSFSLSPNAFYFIGDYLAVGTGVTFDFLRAKFANGRQRLTNSNITLSPQVRFYLSETGSRQQWFIAGGAGFQFEEIRFQSDIPVGFAEETSTSSYQLGLGFGLNTFLTPNIAFELGPNLIYVSEVEFYRLGFDIGLQYFINKAAD